MDYGHEENKIYGILFDGAWLWEEYIAAVLKENTGIVHQTTRDKLFNTGDDDVKPGQGISASHID
ncbi:hypothetical protein HP1_128 [Candidatus Termititenax spirochaetophilus]|uniref:Uncharacterized protein n=1 Tax=Candidatus Termititenax spirochaetophilus TaxID=2218522 RepID=A0A388T6X0_9BACT|nr:hypothetical protein HP1_128 [Candidatus Termititenax spirochaetophilus]